MKRLILLLLLFAGYVSAQYTTVADTLSRPTPGETCSGSITITYPSFYVGGTFYAAGTISQPIINGALSVQLVPGNYSVSYLLAPNGCNPTSEFWIVPSSMTPVNLGTVRTLNPPVGPTLIPLGWLTQSGAAIGQVATWNGTAWAPASSGGSPAFSNLLTGTNTTAAMTVGSGSELTYSGTGINNSNELLGVPFCSGFSPTTGQVLEYTTGGTPNPCYQAANAAGGSVTAVTGVGPISSSGGTTPAISCSTCLVSGGAVTSIGLAGTANEITVTGASPITGSGSWTLSIPNNPTLPGTTTGTFSGNLTGNVTGNVSGTAATITGALALTNTPLTTEGDLLITSASPALARLAIGSSGQCLTVSGGLPAWTACPGGGLVVGTTSISSGTNGDIEYNNSGVLGEVASSGTGNVVRVTSATLVTPALGTPSALVLTNATGLAIGATPLTTAGDLLYANATPGLARLAIGSSGQCLTVSSSLPAWAACPGGGGLSFPFTVVQEGSTSTGGNTSSYTVTFGQTTASSGNTIFLFCGADGSTTVGLPSGWTSDISQTEASYARLLVLHKATAGDTAATFTMSSSTIACYYAEFSGSHTLDQVSKSGIANAETLTFPSITPSAGAAVFALAGYVCGGTCSIPPPLNPAWRGVFAGQYNTSSARILAGFVYAGTATATATLPPQASFNGGLFSSGGIAYATFSIL